MMYLSTPIEIGPGLVPGAIRVANDKREIAAAIGRKGLLGHRGPSLVAIAAADLARTRFAGADAVPAAAYGVVAVAPRASREAVVEVDGLAADGRHRLVSILDAPNVSPNVVSAAVSIRLGARGPAFTVDSATDGVPGAWRLSVAMLRAGRCPRVLLLEVVDGLDGSLPVAVAAVIAGQPSPVTGHEAREDALERRWAGPSALATLWSVPLTARAAG
jgi:Beta-ketoacyl synthase, N-terminal domain